MTYSEIDSFFVHFKKSKLIFIEDTTSAQKTSLWLLREHKSDLLQEWFSHRFKDSLNLKLQKIYFSCEKPNVNDTLNFTLELTKNYLHFIKIEKKKPIIAACLSIIPGLGELYIGNRQKGFLKLLMNTALAFQTKESLEKAPDALILNGINIGFFATFYIVNIYGAFIDTKTKKTDLKNQLYINVANYYNNMLL